MLEEALINKNNNKLKSELGVLYGILLEYYTTVNHYYYSQEVDMDMMVVLISFLFRILIVLIIPIRHLLLN